MLNMSWLKRGFIPFSVKNVMCISAFATVGIASIAFREMLTFVPVNTPVNLYLSFTILPSVMVFTNYSFWIMWELSPEVNWITEALLSVCIQDLFLQSCWHCFNFENFKLWEREGFVSALDVKVSMVIDVFILGYIHRFFILLSPAHLNKSMLFFHANSFRLINVVSILA